MQRALAYIPIASLLALVFASCQDLPTNSTSARPLIDIAGARHDEGGTNVIFVQADASDSGDGSKEHPYNTFADVENNSLPGDKITVLYSRVTLDGGITLKDGQKLQGKSMKGDGTEMPTISNHSATSNGGHAIVLANDNMIQNVHIDGAYHTGIKGKNVTGTKIHDVLIEDINQGSLGFNYGRNNPAKPSGIVIWFDVPRPDGKPYDTDIKATTIRDALKSALIITTIGNSVAHTSIDRLYVDHLKGGQYHEGAVVLVTLYSSAQTLHMTNSIIDNVEGVADGLTIMASHASFMDARLDGISILNSNDVESSPYASGLLVGSSASARSAINVQNSEIIGLDGPGWEVYQIGGDPAPFDPTPGAVQDPYYIDLDLGGGPYGSKGNNRFFGNGKKANEAIYLDFMFSLEGFIVDGNVTAKNNWWGTPEGPEYGAWDPQAVRENGTYVVDGLPWYGKEPRGTFDFTPFLTIDPRSDLRRQ